MKGARGRTVSTVVDQRTANRLEATRSRTGLSISEQVRLALTDWLERLGWPTSREQGPGHASSGPPGDDTGGKDPP
jgi:hypothetical protein